MLIPINLFQIEKSTTQFENVSPGSARNDPSTARLGDDSEARKYWKFMFAV